MSILEPPRILVAPRDGLELQLCQIWEDLLGRRPIGVDEDFFELGGDSLLALALLARIAQDTGRTVPTAGIFQAPTIEKLAKVLRTTSQPAQWSPLVPIQSAGSQPPFFCIHPSGGNVLCYQQLSRHLGPDQPFYGLECRGIDGSREPLTTIEDMWREYVTTIRRVQPHGPYALGGWSVGGVLAYEMAQQLRAAGEEISVLALIDSGVLYCCALLLSLFPKSDVGVLDVLRQGSKVQMAEFRARSEPARIIPAAADDELASRIMHVFMTNMRAVLNYDAQPYDGTLTLFQASEPIVKARFQPVHEWSRRCNDMQVVYVPGSHLTMIHESHVSALAEQLQHVLAAAGG